VTIGVTEVEHAADVGVADGARDFHLAGQTSDPAGLLRARRVEDLHRHRFAQHAIPGSKDHPAAAFADGRFDLIAGVEQRPRFQRHDLAGLALGAAGRDGVLVLDGVVWRAVLRAAVIIGEAHLRRSSAMSPPLSLAMNPPGLLYL
jgi:hypothetical protein